MSKKMNFLVLFLIGIMMGAIGFLGMQVSKLNDLYYANQHSDQNQVLDAGKVTQTLDGFNEELKTHKETLKAFSANLTKFSKDVKHTNKKLYMPAPEYVVGETIFKIEKIDDKTFNVSGDKNLLHHWIDRNSLFLEHILTTSFPLEYNNIRKRLEAQDIVPQSIFHQMGIRSGDLIVSINGAVLNRGSDLRQKLMKPTKKQVIVARGDKRITLNISYIGAIENEVYLSITKKQFNETVSKFSENLKIAPVMKNGRVLGLRILDIRNPQLTALMQLKRQDVITKINGKSVTKEKLISALQSFSDKLEIDILRGKESSKVVVNFSD